MARDGPETANNLGKIAGQYAENMQPNPAPKKAPASRLISAAKPPSVTSHERTRKPRVSKVKKPTASSGFFFRKNGAGWDLRRDVYVTSHDGEKKRKQPYVAHMSQEAFRELKRKHKGAALDRAVAEWIKQHDKS